MSRTASRKRNRIGAPFVVTAPMLAALGCTPPFDTIAQGASCSGSDRVANPQNTSGCGLNGYECRDGTWREMLTFCNPPPPDPQPRELPSSGAQTATAGTVATDPCAAIKEGSVCAAGTPNCLLQGKDSACGLNGYQCRDGKWQELMTFCNPPPPNR